MAYVPVPLYKGQPGTSNATVYTSTSTRTLIKQIVVTNTTGAAATLTLYNVTSAGSAAANNALIYSVSFPGFSVTTFDMTIAMASGDFLVAVQGTASALTVHISGVTY